MSIVYTVQAAAGTGGTMSGLAVSSGTPVRVVWGTSHATGYPNVAMLETNGAQSYTVWGPSDETTPTWVILPTVYLGVYDSSCVEYPQNNGWFRFYRTGSLANSLTINFTRSGTADYGVSSPDYYFSTSGGTGLSSTDSVSWSVTFPVYEDEVYIIVWPYADGLGDDDQTVVLALPDTGSYDGVVTSNTIIIDE